MTNPQPRLSPQFRARTPTVPKWQIHNHVCRLGSEQEHPQCSATLMLSLNKIPQSTDTFNLQRTKCPFIIPSTFTCVGRPRCPFIHLFMDKIALLSLQVASNKSSEYYTPLTYYNVILLQKVQSPRYPLSFYFMNLHSSLQIQLNKLS